MNLLIKKLDESAIIPTKAHSTDLGYDLYALETIIVGDNVPTLVRTGIGVKFPEGWGGFIKDRSSMATKLNLQTVAGVIDEDYTGEIKVALLTNQGTVVIEKGQKIAQLVPIPVTNWDIIEVENLPETVRGEKGFGSSGK